MLEDYRLLRRLAVQWNPDLAARFPEVDHGACRQRFAIVVGRWQPVSPIQCLDWHCPRCGAPTNCYGHHDCEAT